MAKKQQEIIEDEESDIEEGQEFEEQEEIETRSLEEIASDNHNSGFSERREALVLENSGEQQRFEEPAPARSEAEEETEIKYGAGFRGQYESKSSRATGGIINQQTSILDGRRFGSAGQSWGKTKEEEEEEKYRPFEMKREEEEDKLSFRKRRF